MEIIHHHPHGDDLHDLCIFLTERLCVKRKYVFLNPAWLKNKSIYPGVPDVYVRVPMRSTSSGGRATHSFIDYVIEIETHASSESVLRKLNQFKGSNIGHELLIIDLDRFITTGGDSSSWVALENYIASRLPT